MSYIYWFSTLYSSPIRVYYYQFGDRVRRKSVLLVRHSGQPLHGVGSTDVDFDKCCEIMSEWFIYQSKQTLPRIRSSMLMHSRLWRRIERYGCAGADRAVSDTTPEPRDSLTHSTSKPSTSVVKSAGSPSKHKVNSIICQNIADTFTNLPEGVNGCTFPGV